MIRFKAWAGVPFHTWCHTCCSASCQVRVVRREAALVHPCVDFRVSSFHERRAHTFSIGPLVATYEGAFRGFTMAFRLVLLVLGTSILTLTTSPIELTDGLENLMSPMRRVGIPAHELAMMMTIALRFIPTLLEETEKIMKAQMARGADFETGNALQRAKSLIPLLVPLFVNAFRRADELAMAMEARCYRGGEGRTRMKQMKLTARDVLAGMAVTAGMVVIGVYL